MALFYIFANSLLSGLIKDSWILISLSACNVSHFHVVGSLENLNLYLWENQSAEGTLFNVLRLL